MIRLSKEQVLMLHKHLIESTGGSIGIRHKGHYAMDYRTSKIVVSNIV